MLTCVKLNPLEIRTPSYYAKHLIVVTMVSLSGAAEVTYFGGSDHTSFSIGYTMGTGGLANCTPEGGARSKV